MFLALALVAQAALATPPPTPAPLTADQRIEAAAKAIVDESGAPFIERINWAPVPAPQGASVVPEMRVDFTPTAWHRAPRSLKRDVAERLVKLDWRASSFATHHFHKNAGAFIRLYVGETFLGRIELRDSAVTGRDDRFRPSRAWADQ